MFPDIIRPFDYLSLESVTLEPLETMRTLGVPPPLRAALLLLAEGHALEVPPSCVVSLLLLNFVALCLCVSAGR